MASIARELARYGAPENAIIKIESGPPSSRLVPYLDLLRSPGLPVRPAAVVEFQRRPILYAVTGGPGITDHLPSLRRALAFRGDAEFLGVVEPGKLTVFTLSLGRETQQPEITHAADANASSRIPELTLSPTQAAPSAAMTVHTMLLALLEATSARLTDAGIAPADALSLVGRALFLRFLIDRGLVERRHIERIAPTARSLEAAFADPAASAATCAWLDSTFNGDLLPLPEHGSHRWFQRAANRTHGLVFEELSKILTRTDDRGQLHLDWGEIDFGHVPVGLLSQVYERHSHRFDVNATSTSIHYTPRFIAEYLIAEVLHDQEDTSGIRILDPAVGAGVFLVAALRQLVSLRWRQTGTPPTAIEVRKILNTQLVGFDINESALRLAALSLYLTVLELEPKPTSGRRLKFDNLRGKVLLNVHRSGDSLGSLRADLLRQHSRQYDVVVGNPPWTALREKAVIRDWVPDVREFVSTRLHETIDRFEIPDGVPDLAFLWQAARWAKDGGRIAFAMHARTLFKQSAQGIKAREWILRGLRVTGILNGAGLRQTEVWPEITAPFCLIFAENRVSQPNDTFYFASPEREDPINRRGRMRVDSTSATPVRVADVLENPSLLKTLFRGTSADVSVVSLIRNATGDGARARESARCRRPTGHDEVRAGSIGAYWKERRLACGLGYQVGGAAGSQQNASELTGLPDLTGMHDLVGFEIDASALPVFWRKTLLRPRNPEIYAPPLVIIKQSPPTSRSKPSAAISRQKLVFDRSYFGYSCAGHPNQDELADYLLVLFNSRLPLYYALLTSSQFGVERDTLLKEDIDAFPFIPYEKLSGESRERVAETARALRSQVSDWSELADACVESLYGLNRWHSETISDSLEMSLPYAEHRRNAQAPPHRSELEDFIRRLHRELCSIAARGNSAPIVRLSSDQDSRPWLFISISMSPAEGLPAPRLQEITRKADSVGASLIVMESRQPRGALVGLLAQRRYWTQTRARILAASLLTEHAPIFDIPERS